MKNIVLAGLMGAGKTTVAQSLKNILKNFALVEIDRVITEKEGVSINEIFSKKGEAYFRTMEKSVIEEILNSENQIISLGGGSLENNFNFEKAKKNSVIFYLKADVEILYERIKNSTERPLLKDENPKAKLADLLKIRQINYEKADFIINVSNISAQAAAEEIARVYNYEAGNY